MQPGKCCTQAVFLSVILSAIAPQMQQVTMFMLENTNNVPSLAMFSCVLCLTSNVPLHISFDRISMIKEVFRLSSEILHVLMSYTIHRFHKRTEAIFHNHVFQQLGSSSAGNLMLCSLGTTVNGLVTCEVSVTCKKVIRIRFELAGLFAKHRAGDR